MGTLTVVLIITLLSLVYLSTEIGEAFRILVGILIYMNLKN